MYLPTIINRTSSFQILGSLGGIFSFLFNLTKKLVLANIGEPDQTLLIVASDLVVLCLLSPTKRTLGFYGLIELNLN